MTTIYTTFKLKPRVSLNLNKKNELLPILSHYFSLLKIKGQQLTWLLTFISEMAQSASRCKYPGEQFMSGGRLRPQPGGSHAIIVYFRWSRYSISGLKSSLIPAKKLLCTTVRYVSRKSHHIMYTQLQYTRSKYKYNDNT